MSLNRHKWLISPTIFHDHNTVRADFLEDRFACMKWFLTEFEKKKKKCAEVFPAYRIYFDW